MEFKVSLNSIRLRYLRNAFVLLKEDLKVFVNSDTINVSAIPAWYEFQRVRRAVENLYATGKVGGLQKVCR